MRTLLIILFLLIGNNVYSQQTFTQTFVDRCTGEVRVVTANFVNGSATVAFYNKIRTFTYAEFTSGVLQQWLIETYEWWNTLSPCSSTTATTQTAQQTAQTATAAASSASSAASTAASAAASSASTTGGTTNGTNQTTGGGTTTESTNTDTPSSTESSSTENSSGGSEGESGGGEETSSETSESESEGGETESESEESSEESSSEEESEEGGDDEESGDDDGDGEESEEEEEVEKKEMLPIQLRADMMGNQNLLGGYDIVTSIGATQSSIFGDVSYGATAMIYSNLQQFALNTSYTKVHMEKLNISALYHNGHTHYSKTSKVDTTDPTEVPLPKLKHITSASLGYMNNFGNGTIVASIMEIKPMGKWGTAGVGVNMINMFSENKYQMTMIGYNVLYTNMIMVSPRVQYAPALIWTQTPYMGKLGFTKTEWGKNDKFAPNQLRGTEIDGMIILSNSFTLQLTRRFSVNVGATFIKSTNPLIPLIKSFAIGSKLPF